MAKSVRTIRGVTAGASSTLVSLDNMNVTKNFRIKRWYCWTTNGGASGGNAASLSTLRVSGAAGGTVSDNQIFGWGFTGVSFTDGFWCSPQLLDPNHIIVEDMFVNNLSGSNEISWMIELEVFPTSEDEAIIYMLKERAQGTLE